MKLFFVQGWDLNFPCPSCPTCQPTNEVLNVLGPLCVVEGVGRL